MIHHAEMHCDAYDKRCVRVGCCMLDDALRCAAMRWRPESDTGMAISYGSDR